MRGKRRRTPNYVISSRSRSKKGKRRKNRKTDSSVGDTTIAQTTTANIAISSNNNDILLHKVTEKKRNDIPHSERQRRTTMVPIESSTTLQKKKKKKRKTSVSKSQRNLRDRSRMNTTQKRERVEKLRIVINGKERDFISAVTTRTAIAFYFVNTLNIPGPEEWEGRDGTVSTIIKGLNIPNGSRNTVKNVVKKVWDCIRTGTPYSAERKPGSGGHNKKIIASMVPTSKENDDLSIGSVSKPRTVSI